MSAWVVVLAVTGAASGLSAMFAVADREYRWSFVLAVNAIACAIVVVIQ